MTKHVVSFSGGKDSTAMLLLMLEKQMPIDYILFCDTGKEFPEMYEHLEQVKKYVKEKYGREITVLKSERSYDYWMFEHVKIKGKNKGQKGYGWANSRIRWCTANLKRFILYQFFAKLKDKDIIEYVGIARDEEKRIKNYPNKRYPLYEWNMTEADALQYCYDHGFTWGGLYENFHRVSCWCCPLKSLKEFYVMWDKYPELWQKLKEMDSKANNQFRSDYTLDELETKFAMKKNGQRYKKKKV